MYGQTLTAAGVATLNHQMVGGAYALTGSLGLPAAASRLNGGYLLTEGLQQPRLWFVSVGPREPEAALQVYPNPAHEALFISAPTLPQVELLDLAGRRLPALAPQPYGDRTWRLPLGDLAAGPYLLRLRTAEKFYTYKIISY